MKRLFALILVVIMCFSLVACGGDEISNNDDVQTIAATDIIETDGIAPDEGNEQLDNVSNFIPYMCGEWKVLSVNAEGLFETATITDDGNINIDGSSYELKLQSESEAGAQFEIIDSESSIGNLHFSIEDNGDLELYLQGFSRLDFALYKPDHYETITVTKDNVYDYFEFRDFWTENRNAFGELTSVSIETKLVLKEEYYSRISQWLMGREFNETVVENGAIEWLFKRSGLDVVIDFENKTYEFENFQSGTEDTNTNVKGFACNDDFAGFICRTLRLTPDEEGRSSYTWACAYEIDITRIELDLYLIAEKG